MVDGLLGRQSLVLIHFHQPCDQALCCRRTVTKETGINRRGFIQDLITKTKAGTGIRDFIPVGRVKLIIACEDFSEQVLIMVFIIVLIAFIIEGGVTRQPEETEGPGIVITCHLPWHNWTFYPFLSTNIVQVLQMKCRSKNLLCSEQSPTYSMYMMTPVAQQSTGLPYLCLPTTSGAAQEHSNLVIPDTTGCNTPEKAQNILSPRYSGVPQGSLISPFSSLARWKSLMTILECFRRL